MCSELWRKSTTRPLQVILSRDTVCHSLFFRPQQTWLVGYYILSKKLRHNFRILLNMTLQTAITNHTELAPKAKPVGCPKSGPVPSPPSTIPFCRQAPWPKAGRHVPQDSSQRPGQARCAGSPPPLPGRAYQQPCLSLLCSILRLLLRGLTCLGHCKL